MLSDEQVEAGAKTPSQVRDGKSIAPGVISTIWTAEDVAEAKRRLASDEPRYTTAQVLEYLHRKTPP